MKEIEEFEVKEIKKDDYIYLCIEKYNQFGNKDFINTYQIQSSNAESFNPNNFLNNIKGYEKEITDYKIIKIKNPFN